MGLNSPAHLGRDPPHERGRRGCFFEKVFFRIPPVQDAVGGSLDSPCSSASSSSPIG